MVVISDTFKSGAH